MPGTPREEGNAPYIPFRTFLNLVAKMEDGVPQRLDSSFLASQAGGMHQPIIAAFRYLGLVDKDGHTQSSLHELATAGDDRPAAMRKLVEEHYGWANLSSLNATQAQLDEAFKERTGLTGSTLRKAVTFLLHAAKYAQIPVSKHFSIPRGAPGGSGSPRRQRTAKRRLTNGQPLPPKPPGSADYSNLDPMASAFIDSLVKHLTALDGGFDEATFDKWAEAFKTAAPLWATKKGSP